MMKDISEMHAAVGPADLVAALEQQCVPLVNEAADRLTQLLATRRFSSQSPPPPERVIYRIGDATIATPGNIVGFCAQPKAGKTAFLGGVLASTMAEEADTFDVHSSNPDGWAVLHMDTEQSPQHHHKAIARALHRAGQSSEPDWLYSYRVADLSLTERRDALRHEIKARHAQHGAIHSVFLDGIADFIADPNNPEEAFAWVDELHQLAIRYETVILCVLHENPGSEFGKTRGHLGSQLERKAETNLRLVKDNEGVTVVFTERSRQAHIPRAAGSRFAWDDEAMMHRSCETKATVRLTARQKEQEAFAREVFSDLPPKHVLKWRDIMDRIKDIGGFTDAGARKRLAAMLSSGAVKHTEKGY